MLLTSSYASLPADMHYEIRLRLPPLSALALALTCRTEYAARLRSCPRSWHVACVDEIPDAWLVRATVVDIVDLLERAHPDSLAAHLALGQRMIGFRDRPDLFNLETSDEITPHLGPGERFHFAIRRVARNRGGWRHMPQVKCCNHANPYHVLQLAQVPHQWLIYDSTTFARLPGTHAGSDSDYLGFAPDRVFFMRPAWRKSGMH
jgi:hypothetical protein